ncbi:hypothetical protein ABPG72_014179 [Tetrahymena utriculariae]
MAKELIHLLSKKQAIFNLLQMFQAIKFQPLLQIQKQSRIFQSYRATLKCNYMCDQMEHKTLAKIQYLLADCHFLYKHFQENRFITLFEYGNMFNIKYLFTQVFFQKKQSASIKNTKTNKMNTFHNLFTIKVDYIQYIKYSVYILFKQQTVIFLHLCESTQVYTKLFYFLILVTQ